jgi:hypothetical protein
LRDNFDDGNAEGWRLFDVTTTSGQVEWSVENGELVLRSKNVCGRTSGLIIDGDTWMDYKFECQFKMEQIFPVPATVCTRESAFGIGVRGSDGPGYSIMIFWIAASSANGSVWVTIQDSLCQA